MGLQHIIIISGAQKLFIMLESEVLPFFELLLAYSLLFANKIWHTSENINRKIYIFYSGEISKGDMRRGPGRIIFPTVNTSKMRVFLFCLYVHKGRVFVELCGINSQAQGDVGFRQDAEALGWGFRAELLFYIHRVEMQRFN